MARRGDPNAYVDTFFQEMPAGEFIRTKNDNAYKFNPAPEAEALVQELLSHGLRLDARPNDPGHEYAAGYYIPQALDGGHRDKDKRAIYMMEEHPTLYTLAHEQGHALDPDILRESQMEVYAKRNAPQIFSKAQKNNDPVEFLNQYLLTQGPKSKFRSELEAERYAQQFMVDQGYGDSVYRKDGGEYPMQYIQHGIKEAERRMNSANLNVPDQLVNRFYPEYLKSAEIFPQGATFNLKVPIDANTEFDASDNYTASDMGLGLNTKYQKAKQDQIYRALELAEKTLGDFTQLGELREEMRGSDGIEDHSNNIYNMLRNQY